MKKHIRFNNNHNKTAVYVVKKGKKDLYATLKTDANEAKKMSPKPTSPQAIAAPDLRGQDSG